MAGLRLRVAAVAFAAALPLAFATLLGGGCAGGGQGAQAVAPTTSAPPAPSSSEVLPPLPDAYTSEIAVDAAAPTASAWTPAPNEAGLALTDAPAPPPPPCWKGFVPTGNADADVATLGARCAQGMNPLIPAVKQSFKAGESKSIPAPLMPGCYRVIAVGGAGVKDVDLALKDASGKIIAADMTPDDVFPMIHPNKEFCAESMQFLTLVITVKKGAGDVAGGVWKR